jgi:hypothetical protein
MGSGPVKQLLELVQSELTQQIASFDNDPSDPGYHFHFVDIWPKGTRWSGDLLLRVLHTIDRTLDRDDVVAVILIQQPRLRFTARDLLSPDDMARMLMSNKKSDPPAVYLLPRSISHGLVFNPIDGLTAAFFRAFPGWSIGVQPVAPSHPDFRDPPIGIFRASAAESL